MKKAFRILLLNCLGIICFECLFILTSCGLDTYIVIEAPYSQIHIPDYSNTIDFAERYFEFWTNESGTYPGNFKFLGTDVYYKIYDNKTTMESEKATLESLASSTDTSTQAPTKLTEGFAFKQLKASNYSSSPLIAASSSGKNQDVYLRLTNYQDSDEYKSRIIIDKTKDIGAAIRTTSDSSDLTFDFGRTGEYDKKPVSGDEDYKEGTKSEDGKWFICMFAVAVGRDSSYINYYSNIMYLGSITIDDTTYDN